MIYYKNGHLLCLESYCNDLSTTSSCFLFAKYIHVLGVLAYDDSFYVYPSDDLYINPQGIFNMIASHLYDQNDTKIGDKSGLQQEFPARNTIKDR